MIYWYSYTLYIIYLYIYIYIYIYIYEYTTSATDSNSPGYLHAWSMHFFLSSCLAIHYELNALAHIMNAYASMQMSAMYSVYIKSMGSSCRSELHASVCRDRPGEFYTQRRVTNLKSLRIGFRINKAHAYDIL